MRGHPNLYPWCHRAQHVDEAREQGEPDVVRGRDDERALRRFGVKGRRRLDQVPYICEQPMHRFGQREGPLRKNEFPPRTH